MICVIDILLSISKLALNYIISFVDFTKTTGLIQYETFCTKVKSLLLFLSLIRYDFENIPNTTFGGKQLKMTSLFSSFLWLTNFSGEKDNYLQKACNSVIAINFTKIDAYNIFQNHWSIIFKIYVSKIDLTNHLTS